MSPFCKFRHFQKGVTKRDKKRQKVTKSDIASRRQSGAQKGHSLAVAVHIGIASVLVGGASVPANPTRRVANPRRAEPSQAVPVLRLLVLFCLNKAINCAVIDL